MEFIQLYICQESKRRFESIFITLRDTLAQRCNVKVIEKHTSIDTSIITVYVGVERNPEHIVTPYNKTIIVQLEQLHGSCGWMPQSYKDILQKVRVWDYCKTNCRWLKDNLNVNAETITFGYHHIYMLPYKPQTIGVLFYGDMSPRRQKFINILFSQGIAVHMATMADNKKEVIANSMIVINIHYDEVDLIEYFHLLELLAGARFVISEASQNQDDFPQLDGGVVFTPLNDPIVMAQEIKRYIMDSSKRVEIMSRGMKKIINLKNTIPAIDKEVKMVPLVQRNVYSGNINLVTDISPSMSSRLEEACFKDYFERLGGYNGTVTFTDKPSSESVNLVYKCDRRPLNLPHHSIIFSFNKDNTVDECPVWSPNVTEVSDLVRLFMVGRIPYSIPMRYMCDVCVVKTNTSNQFKDSIFKYSPVDYIVGLHCKILIYKYDGVIPYFTLLHALNHGIIVVSDYEINFEPFDVILKTDNFPGFIEEIIHLDTYTLHNMRLQLLRKIRRGSDLSCLNFSYQELEN